MFEGKSLFEILNMGGWTLYILLIISILSISIILLKIVEFRKKSIKNIDSLLAEIKVLVNKKEIFKAIQYCETMNKPVSNAIIAGLKKFLETNTSHIEETMRRTMSIEVVKLEKYTTFIATIASVPYIVSIASDIPSGMSLSGTGIIIIVTASLEL